MRFSTDISLLQNLNPWWCENDASPTTHDASLTQCDASGNINDESILY
ncbi:MAG: hypothetical protein ACUVQF_08355 [Fervidobacterium sp.]